MYRIRSNLYTEKARVLLMLLAKEAMENWYRTDELEEFISSLKMVTSSLRLVADDIEQWKWISIALHNSLQGAMVMSLRNGNDFRIMPDKLAQKCYKAHREGKPWPKTKMDSFPNLYEKVQSKEIMCFYTHSQPLPECLERNEHIEKLLELRNSFIHFMPQGWSLEVSGMPNICISILQAIHFLCFSSGNLNFYEEIKANLVKAELDIALKLSIIVGEQYAN
jgi:hypothetical protein